MAEWSGVLAWRRFSGRATAVDMDLDRPAGAFGRVLALAADCESPWPLDWLATPMLEGCNFWHVADDRWQGLHVPSLYWYRLGQGVRLCPEGLSPIDMPFSKAIAVLECLGNAIAAGLNAGEYPRVKPALTAWAGREHVALHRRIAIATGFEDPTLAKMQAGQTDEIFWNLRQEADDNDFSINSLLAAARMTTSKLDQICVAAVLNLLRNLSPTRVLHRLEVFTQQLQAVAWMAKDTPFTQGYDYRSPGWVFEEEIVDMVVNVNSESMVSILEWNSRGFLPPVDSVRPTSSERSPYRVSLLDLVMRFSTSPQRQTVLRGFLAYRAELHRIGLFEGFQWINGSFLENVEAVENRPPRDIDVVTFAATTGISPGDNDAHLFDCAKTRGRFHVDAYFVEFDQISPQELIHWSAYWYSIWSHNRSLAWKGFLQVELVQSEDAEADAFLIQQQSTGSGQ